MFVRIEAFGWWPHHLSFCRPYFVSVVVMLSFAVVCVDIVVLGRGRVYIEAWAAMIFSGGSGGICQLVLLLFGVVLRKKGSCLVSRGF